MAGQTQSKTQCNGGPNEFGGMPIIKCDGQHEYQTCTGRLPCWLLAISCRVGANSEASAPEIDLSVEWLCPVCVAAGLFFVESTKGKRSRVLGLTGWSAATDRAVTNKKQRAA